MPEESFLNIVNFAKTSAPRKTTLITTFSSPETVNGLRRAFRAAGHEMQGRRAVRDVVQPLRAETKANAFFVNITTFDGT